MRFRTEIDHIRASVAIGHDTPILLLGSCFTDEIGMRLEADGFEVMRNPFGPLYNPLSILKCLDRAVSGNDYTLNDLVEGPRGYHCLDYASRYSGNDAETILGEINRTMASLRHFLGKKPLAIITLGSAYVYYLRHNGEVVGNCHKLPAETFSRELVSADLVFKATGDIAARLSLAGATHTIFTVSPIRHLADGLHGNQLSKATLLLGLDRTLSAAADTSYFPSYEIMLDDLRDYRFFAPDMKHPSETAVDYIYEKFSDAYFTKDCRQAAALARRAYKSSQHRQIL